MYKLINLFQHFDQGDELEHPRHQSLTLLRLLLPYLIMFVSSCLVWLICAVIPVFTYSKYSLENHCFSVRSHASAAVQRLFTTGPDFLVPVILICFPHNFHKCSTCTGFTFVCLTLGICMIPRSACAVITIRYLFS